MEEEFSTIGIVERDIEYLPRFRNSIQHDAPIARDIALSIPEPSFGPIPNDVIDDICQWVLIMHM